MKALEFVGKDIKAEYAGGPIRAKVRLKDEPFKVLGCRVCIERSNMEVIITGTYPIRDTSFVVELRPSRAEDTVELVAGDNIIAIEPRRLQ